MTFFSKLFRKFLAASISAAIVMTVAAPFAPVNVEAAGFPDVKGDAYYAEPINYLVEKNVLQGYPDGTFKPGDDITRGEAAKIIATVLDLNIGAGNAVFTDVKSTDWHARYIVAVKNTGVVEGYEDGTFKPNAKISRAEMATMLLRGYDVLEAGDATSLPFTDVSKDGWYAGAIAALVENEITTGTTATTFSPSAAVTRGQVATFVYRAEMNLADVANLKDVHYVSATQVKIGDDIYTIGEAVKAIFNSHNSAVLAGAKAVVEVEEGQVVKVTQLVLTANGQISEVGFENNLVFDGQNGTIDGDIRIRGDYISFINTKVSGDLIIDKEAGNVFYANGIEVEGNTIVNGALVVAAQLAILDVKRNLLVFENSSLQAVSVSRSGANLESRGTTSITEISASNNISITASAGVTISKVSVSGAAKEVTINATIENLVINSTHEVTVLGNANVKNVTVENATKIILNTIGEIDNVEIKGETKVVVNEGVFIEKLIVPEGKKVEDIVENYDQVRERIGTVTDTPPAPVTPPPTSGGGGGGGGGSTPTVSNFTITELLVTASENNNKSALNQTADFDGVANDVLITGVKIGEVPENTNVKITSVKVRSIDLVDAANQVEVTVPENGVITTRNIFGALDTGDNGISLRNLRALFLDEQIEITFSLMKTDYTTISKTVTINIGSDGQAATEVSNEFLTFTKNGDNSATVTVLKPDATFMDLKVGVNFDLAELIQIFLWTEAGESQDAEDILGQISLLLSTNSLDDVEIGSLTGKTLTFGGYTVVFN